MARDIVAIARLQANDVERVTKRANVLSARIWRMAAGAARKNKVHNATTPPRVRDFDAVERALCEQELTNLMCFAYLMRLRLGNRRRKQSKEAISLSVHADAKKIAHQFNLDLGNIQKRFKPMADAAIKHTAADIRRTMNTALARATESGVPTGQATHDVLEALNKHGIYPRSNAYVETLVRTHAATAYGAAHRMAYEGDTDLWGYEYVTVGDNRVREEHEVLDGLRRKKDDDFWNKWWPPNGWNCRCQVVAIYDDETTQTPVPELELDDSFAFNPASLVSDKIAAFSDIAVPGALAKPKPIVGGKVSKKDQIEPSADAAELKATWGITKFGEKNKSVTSLVLSELNDIEHRFPDLQDVLNAAPNPLTELRIQSEDVVKGYKGVQGAYDSGPTGARIQIAGKSLPNTGELTLGGFNVDDSKMGMFRHELGHHVWEGLGEEQRGAWTAMFGEADLDEWKKVVSAYGASSPQELYAEAFSAFTHKSYTKGTLPSTMESYLTVTLGSPKSGVPVPKVAAPVLVKTPVASKPVSVPTAAPTKIATGSIKVLNTHIGGSTGAMKVNIVGDDDYVMKTYGGNADQVANEAAANSLYRQLSPGSVPVSKVGEYQGQKAVFNKFEDITLLSSLKGDARANAISKIQDDFVLDAWMGNWDAVGLTHDNIGVTKDGRVLRLDNGGALAYRAQGQPKGKAFSKDVKEIDSLRDPSVNPAAASVYSGITDKQIVEQVNRLEKQLGSNPRGAIRALLKGSGVPTKVATRLHTRFKNLQAQRDVIMGAAPAKPALGEKLPATTGQKAVKVYNTKTAAYAAVKRTNLTESERKAISNFTGDGSSKMNLNARTGKITPTIKDMDAALDKLPGFKGMLTRSVNHIDPNHFEQWKSGKWAQVEWAAFSSTSLAQREGSMVYFIKSKGIHGRVLAPLSQYPHEQEVTMKRGAKFRVTGYAEMGGSRALLLEEIEDGDIPESQAPPTQYTYDELKKMRKEMNKS